MKAIEGNFMCYYAVQGGCNFEVCRRNFKYVTIQIKDIELSFSMVLCVFCYFQRCKVGFHFIYFKLFNYVPENFSLTLLLNIAPYSFDTKNWYSPSSPSHPRNIVNCPLGDIVKRILAGPRLVPFSVHLNVFGGLLTWTLGLKVTAEKSFNALKLVKSPGETPKINGRKSCLIISEMPRLASKVTEIKTSNFKNFAGSSTLPVVWKKH